MRTQRRLRFLVSVSLAWLLSPQWLSGQTGTISGIVFQRDSCIGVPGLTVAVVPAQANKGGILTATGNYGKFEIAAPLGGAQLRVSLATVKLSEQSIAVIPNTRVNVPVTISFPAGNGPSYARAIAGLAVGSKGPEVELLQVRLKDRGYPVPLIDGMFNQTLKSAVTQFQKDHHIKPDGDTHKDSWRAIVCPD